MIVRLPVSIAVLLASMGLGCADGGGPSDASDAGLVALDARDGSAAEPPDVADGRDSAGGVDAAAPAEIRIDSVTPAVLGSDGGLVEIIGVGLGQLAWVAVRDVEFGVSALTETSALLDVPPMPLGAAPVTLVFADGRRAVLPDALTIGRLPLEFVIAPVTNLGIPPVGPLTDAVSVDIDGDGRWDIVAGGSEGLAVMSADGFGRFTNRPVGVVSEINVGAIALGDVDADGKTDAVACGRGGELSVLLAGQDGAWSATVASLVEAEQPGDGCLDLAVVPRGGRSGADALVVEFTSRGTLRTWEWSTAARALRPSSDVRPPLLPGPVPAVDGRLAVAKRFGDLQGLYLATGGTISRLVFEDSPVEPWSSVVLALDLGRIGAFEMFDADDDGLPDALVAVHGAADRLLLAGSNEVLEEPAESRMPAEDAGALGLVVADFDQDGVEDAVVAVGDGIDRFLLGHVGGFSDRSDVLGLRARQSAIPVALDADGDADLDLALFARDGSSSLFLQVAGTSPPTGDSP